MFKELKILKLVLFTIFLIVIIWSVGKSYNKSCFFTEKVSFEKGEEISVFHASNFASGNYKVLVKDLKGKIKHQFTVNPEKNTSDFSNAVILPKNNENKIMLPDTCSSGIYVIDEKYSLIITDSSESDITFVYPYVNNRIYQRENDRTLLDDKIKEFTVSHPVNLDEDTKGLSNLMEHCKERYDVNFISDLNLENMAFYKNTKLLVLYGKTAFYTRKMKENLVDFVRRGGNILLCSSGLSTNVIWLRDNQTISFTKKGEDSFKITSWLELKQDIRRDFGLSQYYAGEARSIKEQPYSIIAKKHPVFEGLESNTIPVEANQFIGAYSTWGQDSIPYIQNKIFYSMEILAYNRCRYGKSNSNTGGIFLIQPDSTSGKILSLGTDGWCLKKNQDKKEIEMISKNAIHYLVK